MTKIQRKLRRREKWKTVMAQPLIYVFCFAGVLFTQFVDFQKQVVDFSAVSLGSFGFAALAALAGLAFMESEGTLEGKKKNKVRRYATAFMMGIGAVAMLGKITGAFL